MIQGLLHKGHKEVRTFSNIEEIEPEPEVEGNGSRGKGNGKNTNEVEDL